MKKKHNNKKNRSLEEVDGLSPPKGKLTGNSPKRSKLDTPSATMDNAMVQDRAITLENVNVDYISN